VRVELRGAVWQAPDRDVSVEEATARGCHDTSQPQRSLGGGGGGGIADACQGGGGAGGAVGHQTVSK
jgi:hypothetical protein